MIIKTVSKIISVKTRAILLILQSSAFSLSVELKNNEENKHSFPIKRTTFSMYISKENNKAMHDLFKTLK